jgi:gp16 family phage-associated protein
MTERTSRPIRTPEEVRKDFARKGLSISKWATRNRLNPNTVSDLLNGRKKGVRGESHRAAVLLGLKDGEIIPESRISEAI